MVDQRLSRRLYHAGSEVKDIFLDWLRSSLYWLEAGRILSMRLPGGNAKEVLSIGGGVVGRIAFDWKSNCLIWNAEGSGQCNVTYPVVMLDTP